MSKSKGKFGSFISNWKKVALALSIVIVLNVFLNVGIDTFFSQPKWEDFCPNDLWQRSYTTEEACVAVGGQWSTGDYYEPKPMGGETLVNYYCDAQFTCQKEYEGVLSVYNRNVFLILITLGALVLVGSFFLDVPTAVVSGLMYGGILSILIGVMRYWSDMDEYLRFIVSGALLVVLIIVGVKKVKDE